MVKGARAKGLSRRDAQEGAKVSGEWISAGSERPRAKAALAALSVGDFLEIATMTPHTQEEASYLVSVTQLLAGDSEQRHLCSTLLGSSDASVLAGLTAACPEADHRLHLCGSSAKACARPLSGFRHVDRFRVLPEAAADLYLSAHSGAGSSLGGALALEDHRTRGGSDMDQAAVGDRNAIMARVKRLKARYDEKRTPDAATGPGRDHGGQGRGHEHRTRGSSVPPPPLSAGAAPYCSDGLAAGGVRDRPLNRKDAALARMAEELEAMEGVGGSPARSVAASSAEGHRRRRSDSRSRRSVCEVLGDRAREEASKKERRARKKRKKHRRSKRESSSASSAGSGRSGSSQRFRGARSQDTRTPQQVARLRPGAHLEGFLATLREYLSGMDGDDVKGALPAVVNRYLVTILLPALRSQVGYRDERELRTLAETLDALVKGRADSAADILVQRFKSIELRLSSGSSRMSDHLELVNDGRVGAVGQAELEQLARMEREGAKVYAATGVGAGPRPGGKEAGR